MVVKGWIHRAAIAGVIVLPVLVSGCGLFSSTSSKPIDPPQVDEVLDDAESPETGQAVQEGKETNLTVYLEDSNGYLAPVALNTTIGSGETAVTRALELMTENGVYANQLPEGFRAVIPQGTTVDYHYDKERKVAVVDFSEPFSDYNVRDERTIVEAITWALTAMTGIEGVEIWYMGAKLPEMPVDGYPLDHVLTRAIGINIELANGVSYGQSVPVTLYFSARTSNNEQYYVPVTRLVASDGDRTETAMKELIAGPLNKKELVSVILPDVEVKSIEKKDNIVAIDLLDETYYEGQTMQSEMLQAIVLSLTENTGATSVQITFNGQSGFVDDQNKSYSEPVGRPHHVNAIKS